jgi:hypothetical protein
MVAKVKVRDHRTPGRETKGRPSAYQAHYAKVAFEFCLLGATDAKLADVFDVTVLTIQNWKKNNPTFREAVWNGKDRADAKVAHAIYQCCIGFQHPEEVLFYDRATGEVVRETVTKQYKPDGQLGLKWLGMRTRYAEYGTKWQEEASKVELSGPGGSALQAPTIIIQPVRAATTEEVD